MELHGTVILEGRRGRGEVTRRQEPAVHERERVVDEAGVDAGDEGPGEDSQRYEHEDRDRNPPDTRRDSVCRDGGYGEGEGQARPDERAIDEEGEGQVRGQPVLAHLGHIDQSALHHVPAEHALSAA